MSSIQCLLQDWAYHSFVFFDDGTIVDTRRASRLQLAPKDLTADQFDVSVPLLWYPADPDRYDRSRSCAAPALTLMRKVATRLRQLDSRGKQDVLDHMLVRRNISQFNIYDI